MDRLISDTPIVERGSFGYQVVDAATGEVMAERNASHFFIPASNAKLYTTAAALVRLGPNYRFVTEVRTEWLVVTRARPLFNDLELIGGGDPNLSGRVLPYQVDAKDGDRARALNDLSGRNWWPQVCARLMEMWWVSPHGILAMLYPDGWTIDDSLYSYGAPVSALTLNDGTVSITVTPQRMRGFGRARDTAFALSHFVYLNQVLTTGDSTSSEVHVTRKPGSNEVILWGWIGSRASPWKEDLGVEDSALFAAEGLARALEERGVTVHGTTRSVYRDLNDVADPTHEMASKPQGTLLAARESAPLWEDVQVTDKTSQNLHAEMLLREVGFVTRGIGTLRAGLDEREAFLKEAGITPDETGFAAADGSGLARQDLVTPAATVTLLRYMWQRPEHDQWLQALPIGGVDGSLKHRFKNLEGAERVHAKTGSISHVATLSGYIETKDHRWLAFSAMVNAANGHGSDVRNFLDRFCELFLN